MDLLFTCLLVVLSSSGCCLISLKYLNGNCPVFFESKGVKNVPHSNPGDRLPPKVGVRGGIQGNCQLSRANYCEFVDWLVLAGYGG